MRNEHEDDLENDHLSTMQLNDKIVVVMSKSHKYNTRKNKIVHGFGLCPYTFVTFFSLIIVNKFMVT